jgi:organic radical activating enzyme
MNLKDKPYFCVLPWMHFHANTNGVNIPCCMSDRPEANKNFPVADGDLQKSMNSPEFKKLRRNMLEDKPSSYCDQCYQLEKYGNHSARRHSNDKYLTPELEDKIINQTLDDGYFYVDVLYFDVRFSNVCNFKCRMCGATYSTKWYEDLEDSPKGPIVSINNIEEFCDRNIDYFKNLQYVYFAGGEPLVQKEHYEFLEWCIKNNLSPELYYQSNGSILNYGQHNIADLWKNFKKVTFSVSVDCFGEVGEYIRTGFDTQKIKNNLNKVVDILGDNKEITINSTFMAWNAYFVTEFFDEIANEDFVLINNVYPQLLIYPEFLQPKVLPFDVKQEAIKKITQSYWYDQFPEKFQPLLENLKHDSNKHLWKQFVKKTKELDKKRSTNYKKVFPWLGKFYG